MCYALYLASPLTLSEVRSMLPAGMAAALLDPPAQAALKARDPDAQTGVVLLHGRCSCALVVPDARGEEWEAELRKRYRAARMDRDAVIRALDRHRAMRELRAPAPGHLPHAFNKFVVEHARNASTSLYWLRFETGPLGAFTAVPAPGRVWKRMELEEGWLREGEVAGVRG